MVKEGLEFQLELTMLNIFIHRLAKTKPVEIIYEPELACHAHFKLDTLKVSANIYASGKATYMGPSCDAIQSAIKYLLEFVPKCKLEEEKERKPVLTDLNSNKPIGKRASAPALNPPNRGKFKQSNQ